MTQTETQPKRAPVTFAFGPVLIVAAALVLAAGALHLYVMPMHFAEAKAYGLFMLGLALVQIAAGAFLLWKRTLTATMLAIVTMVASIVVWLAVTYVKIPYGDGPEAPETIAYVTKLVEVVALVALVVMVLLASSVVKAAGRATVAVVLVALLLGAASGGAAYGAGFVAAKVLPDLGPSEEEGGMHMAPASQPGSSSSTHDGMSMGANATSNATTNSSTSPTSNATGKDPNMPDDPSNCMAGMDMPGCTMAQADYYYKQTKAGQAPPDRALAPVKIELTPQGDGQTGKFTVENGTQQLLISIKIRDDGPGPYAALGPGGQGDLKLAIKGPTGTKTITLNGTSQSIGIDPAQTLFKSYVDGLALPGEGEFTITVLGQGQNVNVETSITERFYL